MAWLAKEAFMSFLPSMLELYQGKSLHEKAIQVGVVQNIRSQALALLDASQEAGRDDMEGESDRNSTLMLLTTLLLGVGVAFVVEGTVGNLGSPEATFAAVVMLSVCLGLALAMLAATLVLVYMNQRRAKAVMRAELAKRSGLRDFVFEIGIKQDLDMLSQHNLAASTTTAGAAAQAPGGTPTAPSSELPAAGRMREHVRALHSAMAHRPAMRGVSAIESVGTLRRDPVYRCVRPAVDKLIFSASLLLLASSVIVFGTRMVEATGSATPLVVFGVCVSLGGVAALYLGASEMCWCTHRDSLSACALWRCMVDGAPVIAYHVLGYPTVWSQRLRATMEAPDDESRRDWLSAPKAARNLSLRFSGGEVRGNWRSLITSRRREADILEREGRRGQDGHSPRRRKGPGTAATGQDDGGMGAKATPRPRDTAPRAAARAATPRSAVARGSSRRGWAGSAADAPSTPSFRAPDPAGARELDRQLGFTPSDDVAYFASVASLAGERAAAGAATPASPWSYRDAADRVPV